MGVLHNKRFPNCWKHHTTHQTTALLSTEQFEWHWSERRWTDHSLKMVNRVLVWREEKCLFGKSFSSSNKLFSSDKNPIFKNLNCLLCKTLSYLKLYQRFEPTQPLQRQPPANTPQIRLPEACAQTGITKSWSMQQLDTKQWRMQKLDRRSKIIFSKVSSTNLKLTVNVLRQPWRWIPL